MVAVEQRSPIHNNEIANALDLLATLLQIENGNVYRVRRYKNAARYVRAESNSIANLVVEDVDLATLPPIGRDIAEKIKSLVLTGKLPLLEELKQRIPLTLIELTRIDGLGVKRVRLLHDELQVNDLEDLRQVIRNGRLALLPGFGIKTQQKISADLDRRLARQ